MLPEPPRGWNYLSDESALLDPDTLRLQALPKALCVGLEAGPLAATCDLVEQLAAGEQWPT